MYLNMRTSVLAPSLALSVTGSPLIGAGMDVIGREFVAGWPKAHS